MSFYVFIKKQVSIWNISLNFTGPKAMPVDVGFRNVEEGELDEDIPPGYPGTGRLSPLNVLWQCSYIPWNILMQCVDENISLNSILQISCFLEQPIILVVCS